MKIALHLDAQPPDVGGGFTYTDETLTALVEKPLARHTFCAAAVDLSWRPRIEGMGWEFIPLPPLRRPEPRGIWRAPLMRRLRRLLPRPVLATRDQLLMQAGVQAVLNFSPFEAVPTDMPFVQNVWDLQHRLQPIFPEASAEGGWVYREKQCQSLLQRATAVIVGNRAGQAEVERFYGVAPERIRRLPHPTPAFALDTKGEPGTDPLQRFGLPSDYLFYPAQFWPHKNHLVLLLAAQELREKYGREIALAFAGSDKGNRTYLEKRAQELGLERQVHFLGFVTRAELIGLYRHATALTFPSFFGPENLPPLEAFGLGCPVVAAKVAGSEEQLGDAALLVDPTDPSAIAEAVQRLATEPALRGQLIERGEARARRFTVHDFVLGLGEIFDDIEKVRRCWP